MIPPVIHDSGVLAVSDGAEEIQLDGNFVHNFVGAYACDANGAPLSAYTGVGGTFLVEVLTESLPVYQTTDDSEVSASVPVDFTVAANLVGVRVTPQSITGATHFRIRVVQNPAV